MNSTSNLFQEIMGIEAISKLNADDISKLRELLGVFLELISRVGQMKADGSLDHLSLEDLNRASKVAASLRHGFGVFHSCNIIKILHYSVRVKIRSDYTARPPLNTASLPLALKLPRRSRRSPSVWACREPRPAG